MKLIDVTLRDGGHQPQFRWPHRFASEYYKLSTSAESINFVELGYWKQTGKFDGDFYHLTESLLDSLFLQQRQKLAVMIDYHYCSKDLRDYPGQTSGALGLIRLTARREDYLPAVQFLAELRAQTGAATSLNIFNVSNYDNSELDVAFQAISSSPPDYVYLADTHGSLDLEKEAPRFARAAQQISQMGATPGFHLHDHSGRAYHNFRQLEKLGFEITDVSLNGLGKGIGNLRLEHVIADDELIPFLDMWWRNEELLSMKRSPFGLVTGLSSVTDHYADQAEEAGMSVAAFWEFVSSLKPRLRDNFDSSQLEEGFK